MANFLFLCHLILANVSDSSLPILLHLLPSPVFLPFGIVQYPQRPPMKMAIRAAIVSRRRKDFGGARILAAREEAWEGAQGERGAEGQDRGSAAV